MTDAPTRAADRVEIERFVCAMFRHADEGTYVSLRTFEHRKGAPPVEIKALQLNGEGLGPIVGRATGQANRAARHELRTVFAPPVCTFRSATRAAETDLANGLCLAVECDDHPAEACRRLIGLLGGVTAVVASGGEWSDPETGAIEPKLHVYVRLTEPTRTPEEHAQLKRANRLAAALVGSDPSAVPLVHPLRWAGSVHRKGPPKLCRISDLHEFEIDLADAAERLEQAARLALEHATGPDADRLRVALDIHETRASTPPDFDPDDTDPDLEFLADAIPNADEPRAEWIKVGLAFFVASEGSASGFNAWTRWAKKSGKYHGGTTAQWEHFAKSPPTRTDKGALVQRARRTDPDIRLPSWRPRCEDTHWQDADPNVSKKPRPNGQAEGSDAAQGRGKADEWPDPAELPEGLPAVQPFDPILLPESLRPWITDIAARMQVPLDFPAVAAMVALGSVVGRKIGIRPKRRDEWTVIPNLFGGIVGRPGLLKTPALQEACRPLIRLEMAAKDEFTRAQTEYDARQRIGKQQKKQQDEKIARDLKANRDPKGILHDLLAGGEEEQPPARRRYLVNDSTIEKLGEILSHNPNGVLIFRDELTGFLRQMDREGHEQDRAFYLEAWNGTGRFTYDRIGRGTVDIEACCVSLLGGIQPGPLAAYLENMAHGGAGDDGLIQRLQLLVWPDVSSAWANVDRGSDSAARASSENLFLRLSKLTPGAKGEQDGIPFLRFDSTAQDVFDEWRTELETRLRSGRLHPALESHLAKYRSLVPSIALLCHLADIGTGPVNAVSLERALAWAEYLESHARRVYDAVIRGDLCAARSLGEHIQAGDLTSPFALRDVYRPGWSSVSTRDAAAAAIGVLLDLTWLRAEGIKTGPAGGRPTACYHINPKLGCPT